MTDSYCHGSGPPSPVAGNSGAAETAPSLRWVSYGNLGQPSGCFLLVNLN